MVKTKKLHMETEWLSAAQAMAMAFEFAATYRFGRTTIGFELRGDDGRRYNFVLESDEINLEAVRQKTGLHDFSHLRGITVYDLYQKEYEISRYGIEVKQGYEKLYDLLDGRDYGNYLVFNENDIFEIEYKLEYGGVVPKRTFADFKGVVERLENAVTSKLEIRHIPKYHMWKKYSYELYPDDPGCGMCGYYVKIFDKATGVEYIGD